MQKNILSITSLWIAALSLFLIVSCNREPAQASTTANPQAHPQGKYTFIELGSVDCIPCKAMVPVMDLIRAELGDQVDVVFHDVWTEEGKPYVSKYGIKVIPTQVLLDPEGFEFFRHEGFFPIDELYPVLKEGGVKIP